MHAKATIAVFLAVIIGLALLNLFTPDKSFSESENRYLKQFPKFSFAALFSTSQTGTSAKYTGELEEYVIDQFVARDTWVGVKTLSEKAAGKRSSGGVYFASEDYLIEMFDTINREQWEKNLSHIADFEGRCRQELGIPVHTLLAPTASHILSGKLPAFAPEVDQQALLEEAAGAIDGLVDISDALLDHSDEYIYYRTDHHWTSLGAFYAADAWLAKTGRPTLDPQGFRQEVLSESFFGTTYSKANLYTVPPDTITAFVPTVPGPLVVDYNQGETVTDTLYEPSYLDKKDKYSVFLNANQSVTRIRPGSGTGRRLLLIKDSYANSFAQMLPALYDEIILIDLRYFKTSVVEFAAENEITECLVLYNLKGFSGDNNLFFLTR